MIAKKSQSALLAKYFGQYKKKPRSKVFAPLAESFRRLGMLDDALKVLKDGIKNHPNYPLGYIVLAHCYFDQQKFELTYNTLRPLVSQNADNISMQKIFAEACLRIGHLEEALDTYKYLLFLNPRDKFFAEQVKRLEDDLMIGHKKISIDQLIKSPDMIESPSVEALDDDWVQVDFNQKVESTSSPTHQMLPVANDDDWVMNKPETSTHPILKNVEIKKRDLEDDYYADEFEKDYGEIDDANESQVSLDAPIVSHTLIDLYCAQAYYDKAIELLEKIIELNPDDQASHQKLNQVKVLRDHKKPELKVVSEQDGHDELISIIESQVKSLNPKKEIIENKFQLFLMAIKERASEIR